MYKTRWLIMAAAFAASGAAAQAQDERRASLQLCAGTSQVYLDQDSAVGLGGGFLVPLTRRLSVGGEAFYAHGDRFNTFFLQPVLRVEDPKGVLTPYLVVASGLALQDDAAINYRSYAWSVQGGVGLKVRVAGQVSVSPELRLGLGALPRFTVGVEIPLG